MAGDIHFYSVNAAVPPGYSPEGVAAYVYPSGKAGRVQLHRFVNVANGSHFYSLAPAVPAGYQYEKVECWVYAQPQAAPATTPFYRFYKPGSDNHFYHTAPDVPAGYVAEGNEGYVIAADDAALDGVRPLYRFYNPSAGIHFYTALSAQVPAGYVAEGITGYVFASPGKNRKRLHRFLNVYSGAHFYSPAPAVPAGYILEAEEIYVREYPGTGLLPLNRYYRAATDDHFYDTSGTTPKEYVYERVEGYVMAKPPLDGGVPLYRFYMPGQGDGGSWLGKAWGAVTGFVETVVDGASTIIGWVAEAVFGSVGWLAGLVLSLIDLLAMLPGIGRVFDAIGNLIRTVFWAAVSLVDFGLSLVGIRPKKKMRLAVIIQRDERGEPVTRIEEAIHQINWAIEVFERVADVRIIPAAPFNFGTAFSGPAHGGDGFAIVEDAASDHRTLDVWGSDGGAHFYDNLGEPGTVFQKKMIGLGFATTFRRVTGYGAPVVAFAVRSFKSSAVGTSAGPLTDFVLVKFGEKVRTLAHECGHACTLPHGFGISIDNLMHASGTTGSYLNRLQISILRASRHVTYF